MDPAEHYLSSLAVDRENYVYAGIGTARANLVVLNPATGEKIQLLPEALRKVGTGRVQKLADGTVYATYEDGSKVGVYRIPIATVPSPDNLASVAGDAFSVTSTSGDLQVGFPTEGGRGTLVSGALEQSNVDMASELTEMIVAQRDYTANSKVVQTSSDLLDVLMNLKR